MKILSVLISALALVSCAHYDASGGGTRAEPADMGTLVGPDSNRARSTEPNPYARP